MFLFFNTVCPRTQGQQWKSSGPVGSGCCSAREGTLSKNWWFSRRGGPNDKEGTFDVLSLWKEHAPLFPNPAQIAWNILSISASSAPSERDFSAAGFVIQERRTHLNPETVDNIFVLHSNLHLKG